MTHDPPVEVPADSLEPEILLAVIESFVLREGTDYGVNEILLDTKIEQIRKQLLRGDVKIVFDPPTESITLLTREQWKRLQAPQL